MAPRTKLTASERAHLIEAAATKLFAEQGYVSTSVEEIVAGAGVTKPMLYRHAESKQELCIRLLERYRDELIAATLQELAPDRAAEDQQLREPVDELERMIDAWLSWVQAHPEATRLLFTPIHGDAAVQRVQQDLYARQRETQTALLCEFAPTLTRDDAVPLAEITRAGFAAIALWWLDSPSQPRATARRALLTMATGIVATAQNSQTV